MRPRSAVLPVAGAQGAPTGDSMPRKPIPTWYFVLVVVRSGDRYLLIQEPEAEYEKSWYLPGGRVEPGESLTDAALRETLEEGGLPVRLDGILRVEHTPLSDGSARLRVIFVASPLDDRPPKSTPDEHSLAAAWTTLDELSRISLRGPDVQRYISALAEGAPVHPLGILGREEGW